MSEFAITYDKLTNTFRDAHGNILVDLSVPPPDLTTAQQAVASAFGYSPETAPDIMRVGSGARYDEDTQSQAHLDTVAAFSTEPELGS